MMETMNNGDGAKTIEGMTPIDRDYKDDCFHANDNCRLQSKDDYNTVVELHI